MKSETQTKHKLAQVRFRHLKREIRNGLSRKSGNCKYNGVVELPVYGQIGVCLYGASGSWNGGSCDDSLGERAVKCPLFECSNSKEQLKNDFDDFLKSSDRAHVAARYPDMAALLWVLDLDGPDVGPDVPQESDTDALEEPDPPFVSSPLPDSVIDAVLDLHKAAESSQEPVSEPSEEPVPEALVLTQGVVSWFYILWSRFMRMLRG